MKRIFWVLTWISVVFIFFPSLLWGGQPGELKLETKEVAAGPFPAREEALKKYGGRLPEDLEIVETDMRRMEPGYYVVKVDSLITTSDLERVMKTQDQWGQPAIALTYTDEAAGRMKRYTAQNIGKKLALLLDHKIVLAATIQDVISRDAVIAGRFTSEEMDQIVSQLRSTILRQHRQENPHRPE